MMYKILNYIWRGWFVILGIILTLVFFIPVYFTSLNKKLFRTTYFFIRLWCFGMFYGMGFRYELIKLTDKKLEKDKQYIFIANHTSIADIMLCCILLKHHAIRFVGKKELEKLPIFGTIYRQVSVLVDRSSPKSRAEVYIKCAEKMDHGDSIMIYPEGGVPDDTSIVLDQFKNGAFTLSCKHDKPIAVFTIVGLKEMFPFDYGKGYPGKVKVYFNDILEPEQNLEHQKEVARNLILNQLKKIIYFNK